METPAAFRPDPARQDRMPHSFRAEQDPRQQMQGYSDPVPDICSRQWRRSIQNHRKTARSDTAKRSDTAQCQ